MLENIRKIGLFMIAAQAVIQFAPGKQYEKYIKLVSSVIILFLFMRPFVSGQADLEEQWQSGMEQAIEKFEQETLWQSGEQNVSHKMLEQLETEIKSRLNENISNELYYVNSVKLYFEEETNTVLEGYEPQFYKIEIEMTKKDAEVAGSVLVEEIVIGKETGKEDAPEQAYRYQEIFAGILGIKPEKVEVTCIGGW